VQSEEANKSIVEGMCNRGVTQFLGWEFGTITAPFVGPVILLSKLNDQTGVEDGKRNDACLPLVQLKRS
jgi:hypothetical protein